jgi:simple sugar transport system permease protein
VPWSSGGHRHVRKLLRRHEFYLAALTLALALAVGLTNPAFLSLANLFDLCKSSTVMGLFALGVLLVLLSGGIDVSFATIGIFSVYVTSRVLVAVDFRGSAAAAFLLAGSLGVLLGLFNAVFIALYRLPTLIVTLGSASIFRGFLLAFVGTTIVNQLPSGMVRFSKLTLGNATAGLPFSFLLFVLAAGVVWLVLRYTMLGRGIYAMGGSMVAAERAGFRVRRVQFFVYGLVGLLSGIAGVVHACTVRNANPFDLVGMELLVIAAVVLGGADIAGGTGTVLGTVLGVFLIVILNNSLILLGIPSYWQKVAVGVVILVSTAVTARRGVRQIGGIGLC